MITSLALPRAVQLAVARRHRTPPNFQPLPCHLPINKSPALQRHARSIAPAASPSPTPSTAAATPSTPSQPAPSPELLAAMERLWALRQQQPGSSASSSPSSSSGDGHLDRVTPPGSSTGSATEAELEAYEAALAAAVHEVEQLAAGAGFDRVNPQLNDGRFRGYTLSGKLRSDLSAGAVTLGRLSFGMYKPEGLLVELQGLDEELALVTKGQWGRCASGAYVVSAPFRVAAHQERRELEQFGGLLGVSHAVASYQQSAENPQRLDVRFEGLRMEPLPGQQGDLGRWQELFRAHNPAMSQEDGVLEVAFPDKAVPKAWLDHLVMIPGWQITQGNFGSKNLLRRVG